MRAALVYEPGKPLVVEDGITVESPGKGEVKVKTVATAVCRSDLHVMEGTGFRGQLPGLPGHETSGIVEEVGEGVTRVQVGDPVCVTTTTVGCGNCPSCLAGYRAQCTTLPMFVPGAKPKLHTKQGKPITTMAGFVGGFAEYTLVRESQLVKLPKDMPLDRAALISCAVITGIGSAQTAGVRSWSSAAVIGTGAVGLNAIQGSAYLGACPVVAIDALDNRLEEAKKFGATHIINTKKTGDVVKAVKEATGGEGADFVFVTVTSSDESILHQAIEMSSKRAVIISIAMGNMAPDNISWMKGLSGFGLQRMVINTAMGSSNIIVDIPRYINLYKAGRIKLDELITARYPLDRINEAIESMKAGKALRNVIMF